MELADPGKWRKSKVESFIRRHLSMFDFGMTRYYEMCMWDHKGTLFPSYAILMDKSIVLTENPPKSIIHAIPLSRIQDISLIADRHSPVKGKNNNAYICQHISIVYENLKKSKNTTSTLGWKKEVIPNGNDDHSNVNLTLPNSTLNLTLEEEQRNHLSHTDLSVTNSNYSDVSVSPVPSFLDESFKSSFILSAYELTMKLDNGNGYAWLRALDNYSQSTSRDNQFSLGLRIDGQIEKSPLTSTSSLRDNSLDLTWNDWNSMNSAEQRSLIDERQKKLMSEMNSLHNLKHDGGYTRRIFSANLASVNSRKNLPNLTLTEGQRTNLMNNRRRRNNEKVSRKKGSNNTIVNETESSEERESKKNKENRDKSAIKKGTQKSTEKMENLQLYFYQRDSEFLNELSLIWNRQQMKNTENDTLDLSKTLALNKSLRAAEKVVARIAQDWNYLEDMGPGGNNNNRRVSKNLRFDYTALLRKVIFLHKCLMRYEQLKYLCWKNMEIISGLINAIAACFEPVSLNHKENSVDFQDTYFDKLAIYAILMDIFRTLFEACNVSWFKETESVTQRNEMTFQNENFDEWETDMWDLKLTILDVTKKLLSSILKCPILPSSPEVYTTSGSYYAVTDSQRVARTPWLMLSEEQAAKMARLICTAHNASAALLFELLAISHFLPALLEKTLVAGGTRQTNLELFIRLSVTQIINILWSTRDPLTASETMMLYRQVWNLRNLARHDKRILQFMRNNFFEEFHYYVRSKGIKSRIPDQYTIKPKVIEACEKLCEEVVGKPGIKP